MRAVVHALVDISACFAVAMIPFITGASVAADVICARGISVARLVLALVYICAHDTVARVALIASAFVVCAIAAALTHTLGDAATPHSSVTAVISRALTREATDGICTR